MPGCDACASYHAYNRCPNVGRIRAFTPHPAILWLLMRALNAAWPGITDCSNHFCKGFDAQYGRFLEVTSGAQQRFEQADWHAVQQAMKNRIHLYDHHVGLVVEQLRCIY
ncbi:isocitrate dehydrogenase kinase/phosphatase [Escherichia coli]|uniref:Isocitrate dehydrogenase kinase/phosphatase n=1 Tax=Escherichia coli TaxID=562 RepID=A0A2X1L2V3_ECOLX|nr:isocitrate dehydrogenase kinase/phosphatase [Escherichia coli]